jgi:hypothetical protein
VAEGTSLLRTRTLYPGTEGSNPSLSVFLQRKFMTQPISTQSIIGKIDDNLVESISNMKKALKEGDNLGVIFDKIKNCYIISNSQNLSVGTILKFLQHYDYKVWHPDVIGTTSEGNKVIRLFKYHSSL